MMGAGPSFARADNPLYSPDELARAERVDRELGLLVDQRRVGQDEANLQEELWRESERRYRSQQREANRTAWQGYHERLARVHRCWAEEHDARASVFREMGQQST